MEIRRVQRSGNSSYIISLPIDWAKTYRLKKNDPIHMNLNPDGSITLFAKEGLSDEDEIHDLELAKKFDPESYFRRLIGIYIRGGKAIRLRSSGRSSPEAQKLIQRFISHTVGFEVVEEDEKQILLKDILNPNEMPMQKALRRMHNITIKMLNDSIYALENKGAVDIDETDSFDDEVDRLNFLIQRKHSLYLKYPMLCQKAGLSLNDSSMYIRTSRTVERIADHAQRISKYSKFMIDKKSISPMQRQVLSATKNSLKLYQESMDCFFSKDVKKADSVIKESIDARPQYSNLLGKSYSLKGKDSIYLAYIAESLRRISDYSSNISEIVINNHE